MKNIAVIPARGGSKRIIGKNIKIFHNKPMIAWVIELAQICERFEKIIVSTDCLKTAEISKSLGAEVPFLRPKRISDDHTSVIEVMRHAIENFQSKDELYELVTLIYPTAPLMNVSDLKKAIRLIGEYDFSMSVASYPYPIQRALILENQSNTIQMSKKSNFMKRSQDLRDYYHDAGQFIVGKTTSWLKKKPIVEGKTLPIIVPRLRVQDIDDEEDWNEAELKFSFIKGEFKERNLK